MEGSPYRLPARAATVLAWAAVLGTMTLVVFALTAPPLRGFAPLAHRVFYFHVPMAILAYATFATTLVASVAYLAKRRARHDHLAAAAAEVGVVLSALAVLTGLAWARVDFVDYRPLGDPKLVSVIALTLVYAGYLALRRGVPDEARRARLAAVFGIVAFLAVPAAYLSSASGRFATVHPGPSSVASVRAQLAIALLLLLPLVLHLVAMRLRLLDAERRLEAPGGA